MADSLCGPSNALQSFQKHSSVDRTLQQDKLVARQSPSQGFRSTSGPASATLDRDFEAFQAGNLPLDHGFQSQSFSNMPPSIQQLGPSNWASDFQRLNLSSPPPQFHPPQLHQSHFNGPQAQQRPDTGGWHQDFAWQQAQMGDRGGQQQQHSMFPYQGVSVGDMYMGSQYMGGVAGPQVQNSMLQAKQPVEQFDDEAFARAFDEAKAQFEITDASQTLMKEKGVELSQEIMINESAEVFMSSESDLIHSESSLAQQERIGSDTIQNPNDTNTNSDNSDTLSRTAAQLLHAVRHEQSSKFQNSQFLELMRQFRDREATVSGDKVVSLMNYDSAAA